jgi:hypothetical protein
MRSVRCLTVLAAAALPLFIALLGGCPKKETDGGSTTAAPTTSAAAPTTTAAETTTTSVTLTPEVDAGAVTDAGKADADAGKPTGTGSAGGLAACCRALEQNQRSAPLDQQGMYIAAIAACKSGGAVPAAMRAAIPACK